jgi:hypothetical protein
VLVIGGSYAGLAATITLLDLCRGKLSTGSVLPEGLDAKFQTPVQIKLVDERDGFCIPSLPPVLPPKPNS